MFSLPAGTFKADIFDLMILAYGVIKKYFQNKGNSSFTSISSCERL
jgi:hypothetical protein